MKTVIPGKTIIFAFSIFVLGLVIVPQPAKGYLYETEQPTSQLVVDKRIKTPAISDWQDNLPANQIVLKENDLVEFEIKVKNTGDQELKKINIIDYLPSYLTLIFGPGEPKDNHELSWQIEKLTPGEEKNFYLRAKIDDSQQARPEGTFCLMNKVRGEAETGETDEDTASFCLVGAKKLPQAGSHRLALGTLIVGIIGGIGVLLRKFGRGEILP